MVEKITLTTDGRGRTALFKEERQHNATRLSGSLDWTEHERTSSVASFIPEFIRVERGKMEKKYVGGNRRNLNQNRSLTYGVLQQDMGSKRL